MLLRQSLDTSATTRVPVSALATLMPGEAYGPADPLRRCVAHRPKRRADVPPGSDTAPENRRFCAVHGRSRSSPNEGISTSARRVRSFYLAQDPFSNPDLTPPHIFDRCFSVFHFITPIEPTPRSPPDRRRIERSRSARRARGSAIGIDGSRPDPRSRLPLDLGHLSSSTPAPGRNDAVGGSAAASALAHLALVSEPAARHPSTSPTITSDNRHDRVARYYLSRRFTGAFLLVTHYRYVLDAVAALVSSSRTGD